MSVSITGQTVYSGSIFYYDTYNVKSYVGEPTTNLALFDAASWFSTDTPANVTQSIDTSVTYNGRSSLRITANTGYWNIYRNGTVYYTQTSNTTFTLSWKMKRADGAAPVIGGYIYTVAISTYPSVTVSSIDNGWYQCYCSYSSTNSTLSLTGFNSTQLGVFYIADWQVETATHYTPYIFGTRSVTQGLLDLTRRNTIDLTDMSYTSTASLTFDGVNDYINTNVPAQTLTNGTVEAWVYDTKNNSGYRAIVQFNVNTDDALYIYPSNVLGFWPCSSTSLTVPSNQWVYVAAAYNGSQLLYCVNGVFQTVTQTCADFTDLQYVKIGGHGTADGERWQGNITEVKVYNRALSSDEILKNYNRSKARYGR
jgi:hypothetical protein